MKPEEKPWATNMRQQMISLLNSVLPIHFNKTNNGKEKKKLTEAETETSQEEIPLLPKI